MLLLWLSGAALCASGLVVLRLNHPLPALAAVGPVDDPVPVGGDETVVRSEFAHQRRQPARRRGPAASPTRTIFSCATWSCSWRAASSIIPTTSRSRSWKRVEDASLELHVHPDDLGHVIGKQGRTARSLRLALGAPRARAGRKAELEIAD